jgi:hypothetical protein
VIKIISAFLKSCVRPRSSETAFRNRLAEDPDTVLRALGVDPTPFDLDGAERQNRTTMWRRRTLSKAMIAGIGAYILGWVGNKAHAQVEAYGTAPGMRPRPKPSAPSDKTHDGSKLPHPAPAAAYGTPPGMRRPALPDTDVPAPVNRSPSDRKP